MGIRPSQTEAGQMYLEGRRALGSSWSSVDGGLGVALLHNSGRWVFAVAYHAPPPPQTPLVVFIYCIGPQAM
jgi:hypothetical protein